MWSTSYYCVLFYLFIWNIKLCCVLELGNELSFYKSDFHIKMSFYKKNRNCQYKYDVGHVEAKFKILTVLWGIILWYRILLTQWGIHGGIQFDWNMPRNVAHNCFSEVPRAQPPPHHYLIIISMTRMAPIKWLMGGHQILGSMPWQNLLLTCRRFTLGFLKTHCYHVFFTDPGPPL